MMKLLDYFAQNCRQHPDAVFYSDDPAFGDYTFAYVDECACRVFAFLSDAGISTEDIVAIRLPRSGRIPIAIIGVMKAGAAFVVLGDRSTPQTAAYILKETAPKLIIDTALYERMMTCTPRAGCRASSPHDLAAIIYSTGSTGLFKGCMHEYGIYDDVVERTLYYKSGGVPEYGEVLLDGRYAMTFGFYTTSAIFQLCYNMFSGEYFDIVPYAVAEDTAALAQRLGQRRISEAFLAPKQIAEMDFSACTSLQYVDSMYEMFSGAYLETPMLINCYGMTESFRALTYFRVDRPYDLTPVGPAYCDVTLKLVDDSGSEVEPGQIGEVWYQSRFFRGYLNRPDLTEQVLRDGWYHTGDIGKFRDDGVLIILGRKVDIRKTPQGWVVPFEIARAAKRLLGLSWAYVRLFGDTTVCLYYCDELPLSVPDVRAALAEQLPVWALPTHCIQIEKVPYFPSGKIKRTAFPEPEDTL